jgi:hypothetical protein
MYCNRTRTEPNRGENLGTPALFLSFVRNSEKIGHLTNVLLYYNPNTSWVAPEKEKGWSP